MLAVHTNLDISPRAFDVHSDAFAMLSFFRFIAGSTIHCLKADATARVKSSGIVARGCSMSCAGIAVQKNKGGNGLFSEAS
jgi:hypothetical protein